MNSALISGILIKATAWIALTSYVLSLCLQLNFGASKVVRWLWSVGCAVFVLHVLAAFHFHHGWSHRSAYEETATMAQSVTGISAGYGVFFNYLFTFLWVLDCFWWWRVGDNRYEERRKWISVCLNSFFVFMVFNGAVIFVQGWPRIIGGILTLTLLGGVVARYMRTRKMGGVKTENR